MMAILPKLQKTWDYSQVLVSRGTFFMNHTTRPLSLSIPDYEHSCVLSAFEMQEVNVENECNATGEMNAVLVNIMWMPRTDA